MRSDDLRHRVKVGDIVSHSLDVDNNITTKIGLVVSWAPARGVANVMLGTDIWGIHVKRLKVISEAR